MKCVSPYYAQRVRDWVPCGKCNFCLQKRRSDWSFRLYQELKAAQTAAFITLTYAPENLVYSVSERKANLEKTHIQAFIRAFRDREAKIVGRGLPKRLKRKRMRSKPIRYYAVGEYGDAGEEIFGEGRPHFHVLMFNYHPNTMMKVSEIWGRGHVDVGAVEPASIAYVSGYVINSWKKEDGRQRPFSVISKAGGPIGITYLSPQMVRYHKRGKLNYGQQYGYKVPLPRLFKDRIFNRHEKEYMRLKIAEEMDKRFQDEISRLQALHDDPITYYQMKLDQAYRRVRTSKRKKRAVIV